MHYCPHCGKEVNEGAAVCLSCGHALPENQKPQRGNTVSLLAVVFGSLGFFPLLFAGSIAGFVLSIIALNDPNSPYLKRAKIGLGLSIGSFILWSVIVVLSQY